MSHSVPSESSAIDTTFIVGADLVQFDRHELPIYQTPEPQWAEACFDEAPYGAPLDRVFGEPGDVHVDGVLVDGVEREEQAALTAIAGRRSAGPSRLPSPTGLSASARGTRSAATATAFDYGAEAHGHPAAHLHDGWSWDAYRRRLDLRLPRLSAGRAAENCLRVAADYSALRKATMSRFSASVSVSLTPAFLR